MQHIETIELGSSQSSITFSSIPQDYDDLILKYSLRTNRTTDQVDPILIQLNSSSSNFSSVGLIGENIVNTDSRSDNRINLDQADDTTANTFGNSSAYISNYTASQAKSISVDTVSENNATRAFRTLRAMLWSDGSAITSLNLAPQIGTAFLTGSTFSLYGVTAGGDGTVTTA